MSRREVSGGGPPPTPGGLIWDTIITQQGEWVSLHVTLGKQRHHNIFYVTTFCAIMLGGV